MRILFTAQTLEGRAGGSLYVRDFMLEFLRRGHHPVVFCTRLGPLATEIRALTIPVIDRLDKLTATPDIIHGNTPVETMAALLHFSNAPAVFTCHGWDGRDAMPPKMARILRYIAVDETCRDRLTCHEGIPEQTVRVHFNPVDLSRFLPRESLPAHPQRALVFSNNASESNYLPSIRNACERSNISLDVVGEGSRNPCTDPENILGQYDLVFAKARCALEALAVGTAVILCDETGMGRMVISHEFEMLRRLNLGRRLLRNAVTTELIRTEIEKYNPEDAAKVSKQVRASAGLPEAATSLFETYTEALEEFQQQRRPDPSKELHEAALFLQEIAPFSNTFYVAEKVRDAATHAREACIRDLSEVMAMYPIPEPARQELRITKAKAPTRIPSGEIFSASVHLENGSQHFLASYAPNPVHLSFHWLDPNTLAVSVFEGTRTRLYPPLPPGQEFDYAVTVQASAEKGPRVLRLTLVQEAVTWFDEGGLQCFIDIHIQIT